MSSSALKSVISVRSTGSSAVIKMDFQGISVAPGLGAWPPAFKIALLAYINFASRISLLAFKLAWDTSILRFDNSSRCSWCIAFFCSSLMADNVASGMSLICWAVNARICLGFKALTFASSKLFMAEVDSLARSEILRSAIKSGERDVICVPVKPSTRRPLNKPLATSCWWLRKPTCSGLNSDQRLSVISVRAFVGIFEIWFWEMAWKLNNCMESSVFPVTCAQTSAGSSLIWLINIPRKLPFIMAVKESWFTDLSAEGSRWRTWILENFVKNPSKITWSKLVVVSLDTSCKGRHLTCSSDNALRWAVVMAIKLSTVISFRKLPPKLLSCVVLSPSRSPFVHAKKCAARSPLSCANGIIAKMSPMVNLASARGLMSPTWGRVMAAQCEDESNLSALTVQLAMKALLKSEVIKRPIIRCMIVFFSPSENVPKSHFANWSGIIAMSCALLLFSSSWSIVKLVNAVGDSLANWASVMAEYGFSWPQSSSISPFINASRRSPLKPAMARLEM